MLRRINPQKNNHNTKKKREGGERNMFDATAVHHEPKEIYIKISFRSKGNYEKGNDVYTHTS